jgi:hypothetical protein
LGTIHPPKKNRVRRSRRKPQSEETATPFCSVWEGQPNQARTEATPPGGREAKKKKQRGKNYVQGQLAPFLIISL